MPTILPPSEKQSFIDLVTAAPYPGGPQEAARLQDILNTYEDIPLALYRELSLFASNNAYLTSCMDVFSPGGLLNASIWYKFTQSSPPINDPILIINSTIGEVILTTASPPYYKALYILGPSNIAQIALVPGVTLNELYIGPGVVVDKLTGNLFISSPPTYARVNVIYLPFMKSTPSSLKMVEYGTNIGTVAIQEGSYYGGIRGDDPQNICNSPVTGMQATDITKDSIFVSWTLPVSSPPADNYLFINVFFRRTNSLPWIAATVNDGDFAGDTGFLFLYLDSDTWYNFKVEVTCLNGGVVSTEITAQTVCCGTSSPP